MLNVVLMCQNNLSIHNLKMASIQERLQMKREPLDKWSVREQLCLVSAVNRSGDQNWMSVSRALKPFGEINRPSDWFHQKNCAAQFGALLANVETPKRKKRASGNEIGIETPVEMILRKLLQERQAELKALLAEERAEYQKLQEDMALLQSGNVSEEQLDIWCKEIDEEEQRKEEEAFAHAQWLKERELRKQEIEKAWRPNKPQSLGHKRKNSDSIDSIFDSEHNEDSQQQISQPVSQEQNKPALSPLLTSLLKSPSQVQNVVTSSILHSAITNQRPVNTSTNPMIASLLNSSANVSVSPSLQQLVSSAIGQEQEVEHHDEGQPMGSDILDDASLPNLKIDDLANSILVPDGPLPEIKNEEVDVIISDLIENAHDIVADPEQHLQLDGNGDININLELDDLEEAEMAEEKDTVQEKAVDKPTGPIIDPFEFQEDPEVFEHTKLSSSMKHQQYQQQQFQQQQVQQELQAQAEAELQQQIQQHVQQQKQMQQQLQQLQMQEQQYQQQQEHQQHLQQEFQKNLMEENFNREFHHQQNPQHSQLSHEDKQLCQQSQQDESFQQGQKQQELFQESQSQVLDLPQLITDSKNDNTSKNDKDNISSENGSNLPTEEDEIKKEIEGEHLKKDDKNVPGSVEIVEVVVMEDDEVGKQLNKSQIQDIVHTSNKDENKQEDVQKPETSEESNSVKTEEESEKSNDSKEFKNEPEPETKPDDKEKDEKINMDTTIDVKTTIDNEGTTLPIRDFSEELYDDINMEIKIDKSGKAKRDYSRTKKKDENEFDLLVTLEKTQLGEGDLADLNFSDKEFQESDSKDTKSKIKSENERSSSPWTEEEDSMNVSNRVRRRYSTPATPVDSIPNSPASSSANYDDEREYRNWKKSVMLVFSRLTTHKYASLFLKPITDDQAPGYHNIVYRPTDLQTIRKNIENGTIRTTQEFQRDVLLMFTNAIMYNKTNDTVYNMARQMQQESLQQIQILLEATQQHDDGPLRRETRTSETGGKRKRGPEDLIRSKKRKEE